MRQAQIVGVPLGYREDMTHVSTTDLDRVLASLDPQPSGTYVFSLVDEIPQGGDLGSSTELAAIGITASIAQILAARSITANFIACRRHDHLFVQPDRAQEASALLEDLGRRAKGWLPA